MSFEGQAEVQEALSALKHPSQSRIDNAVRVCIRHVKMYKHVVHHCDRHFRKTVTPESRLACLFFLDALFKVAKQHPFAQRFEPIIVNVFRSLAHVRLNEFDKIEKLLDVWAAANTFSEPVIAQLRTVVADAKVDVKNKGGDDEEEDRAKPSGPSASGGSSSSSGGGGMFSLDNIGSDDDGDDDDNDAGRLAAQQRYLEQQQQRAEAAAAAAAAAAAEAAATAEAEAAAPAAGLGVPGEAETADLLAALATVIPSQLPAELLAAAAAATATDLSTGGAGDVQGPVHLSQGQQRRPLEPSSASGAHDGSAGDGYPPPKRPTGPNGSFEGGPARPPGAFENDESAVGYVVPEDQSSAPPGMAVVASCSVSLKYPGLRPTQAAIVTLMSRFGTVVNVRCLHEHGFCTYHSRRDAVKAMESLAGGMQWRLKPFEVESEPADASSQASGPGDSGTVVVGWARGKLPRDGFDGRIGQARIPLREVDTRAVEEDLSGLAYTHVAPTTMGTATIKNIAMFSTHNNSGGGGGAGPVSRQPAGLKLAPGQTGFSAVFAEIDQEDSQQQDQPHQHPHQHQHQQGGYPGHNQPPPPHGRW